MYTFEAHRTLARGTWARWAGPRPELYTPQSWVLQRPVEWAVGLSGCWGLSNGEKGTVSTVLSLRQPLKATSSEAAGKDPLCLEHPRPATQLTARPGPCLDQLSLFSSLTQETFNPCTQPRPLAPAAQEEGEEGMQAWRAHLCCSRSGGGCPSPEPVCCPWDGAHPLPPVLGSCWISSSCSLEEPWLSGES